MKVPTGAFVARRNGKVFVTGNSGFPKSLDVSKAIDAAAGAERLVVGKSARHVSGRPEQSTAGLVGTQTFAERVGMSANLTAPATSAARQWSGWGTALKPAWEPIALARKPLIGTVAANVLAHGTGGINVDGCRIGDEDLSAQWRRTWNENTGPLGQLYAQHSRDITKTRPVGRWPANVILDEAAGALLDEQSGMLRPGWVSGAAHRGLGYMTASAHEADGTRPARQLDGGGASRFFYCAKASRSEREAGLESFEARNVNDGRETSIDNPYQRGDTLRKNMHPTVKPQSLMRWLCRLVTPPGGLVLDPFCGSGSTGCGALLEGFRFIGIDSDLESVRIARARLAHWNKP
ncbi:MAG: hypothetical protein A2Y38_20330 [Spirochaetes bacterium GWB1_59_5]|nr:MAG: hypothetical protein A2Y38_20330 [Spirochaetes bacterium GWB1_59_5]